MPIKMFACPPGKPTYGSVNEPVHCITECKHQCYSPHLMAAIVASNQKNHHFGRYVSATALSGCKRRLQLERTVDYAEEFQNLYAAFRGTITHTVIEEATTVDLGGGRSLRDFGFLTEWRMVVGFCLREGHGAFRIPGDTDTEDLASYATLSCSKCAEAGLPDNEFTIILGGTLDGGEPKWDKLDAANGILPAKLHDIKTQKEYALALFIKGDPKNSLHPQIKDDYVKQARVYKYLAYHAEPPEELRAKGVTRVDFDESHIQAFSMGEAPWTGGGTYRWKSHYTHPVKDWPMFPIDLGTPEWVEEYIRGEAAEILDTLIYNRRRAKIIDEDRASNGAHNFRCNYCPFYGSTLCPNPSIEWKMLHVEGKSADEAFEYAAQHPVEIMLPNVGKLDAKDTENVDNFFRRQRGEELVTIKRERKKAAPKPKAEGAAKKSRKKKGDEEAAA